MTKATAEHSRYSDDYEFAANYSGVLLDRTNPISNRHDMQRQLLKRCTTDSGLHQSLLEHPRAIYAVAVEESFGIHRSLFFIQIRHVEVIEEDESTLGVVLPACHLGCIAPRLATADEKHQSQCHICTHGASEGVQMEKPRGEDANRETVRSWIQNRVSDNQAIRDKWITAPNAEWKKCKSELSLPAGHPLLTVESIRIYAESAETIGFVLDYECIHHKNTPMSEAR